MEPTVLMRLAAAERLPAGAPAGRSGTAVSTPAGAFGWSADGYPAPAAGPVEAAAGTGEVREASGAAMVLQLSDDLSALAEPAGEPEARVTVTAPAERGWFAAFAPRERDLGLFLAAQVSLFIDMAQTIEIRRADGLYETNTVLGAQPRDEAVVAYFGSIAALHAVAYAVLPGRWANLVSRGILFIELPAIDNNTRVGIRVQF